MAHEGGVLGLFKGLNATLGRESIGNMAMFGVYELVKQQTVAMKVSCWWCAEHSNPTWAHKHTLSGLLLSVYACAV